MKQKPSLARPPVSKKTKPAKKKKAAAKITIQAIAEMSDAEVYELSMPRPGDPGQRGFWFRPEAFRSDQDSGECMYALLARLQKIQAGDSRTQ